MTDFAETNAAVIESFIENSRCHLLLALGPSSCPEAIPSAIEEFANRY